MALDSALDNDKTLQIVAWTFCYKFGKEQHSGYLTTVMSEAVPFEDKPTINNLLRWFELFLFLI